MEINEKIALLQDAIDQLAEVEVEVVTPRAHFGFEKKLLVELISLRGKFYCLRDQLARERDAMEKHEREKGTFAPIYETDPPA